MFGEEPPFILTGFMLNNLCYFKVKVFGKWGNVTKDKPCFTLASVGNT